MARNQIVPISEISRRAPEAGRIRIGVKSGKGMKSIDTFRFTSPHADLIAAIAHLYGGKVEEWNEPKSRVIGQQWQVITTANQINVYLPANGLDQQYELWSGGGRLRACDGVTVEQVRLGENDEAIPYPSPCICQAKGIAECRPYTRITVVLPEIPFMGTWRLETKGWNAAAELPGMFELVRQLDENGAMVRCVMSVEKRKDVQNGRTRNFVVPTLGILESPREIQSGAAAVGAIGAGAQAELEQPERLAIAAPDVEHVDDDDVEIITPQASLEHVLRGDANQFGLDPDAFVRIVLRDAADPAQVHADIVAGVVEPTAIRNDKIVWKRITSTSTLSDGGAS